jgi:HD superfamily phosphodiesterase
MKTEQMARIRTWYKGYTDSFRTNGKLHYLLELKVKHSERVAQDCREIASDLGWNSEDVVTAEALGLLHDVGRFSQYSEYETFLDHLSVNHGLHGYNIITKHEVLKQADPREEAVILDGVKLHNIKTIPGDLPVDNLRFIKLIRDADKLDIIKLFRETIREGRHAEMPEIMLNIDMKGPPTRELIKEILETGSGSYKHVHSLADINLMRVAWVYTINYLPSIKRLIERNHFDDTMQSLPDDEEISLIVARVKNFIKERLASGR